MYWAIPLLLLFHNCKQDLTSLKVVLFYSPFCGFCFLDIFFQNDSLIITVSCISLTRCPLLSFPNTWLLPWQLALPPRTQFNNGSSSTLWLWGHSCAVIQMRWCVFFKNNWKQNIWQNTDQWPVHNQTGSKRYVKTVYLTCPDAGNFLHSL